MNEIIFWGGAQRFVEALARGAPTILVGLVIAGIFARLLGHEHTRKVFGHGTWRELPQAWLIGMLLPVCSLGVIPIAAQLRRSGLRGGTILAFAMTAPLFNPLSVLYGLSLSEPVVILAFAMGSLIVVTVVGALFDRLFRDSATEAPEPPPVAVGLRRMAAVFVAGAREMAGPTFVYIFIGLLGVALLGGIVPKGRLMSSMEADNPYAALTMTAVATPAYATPMQAMSQLGSMFQHGNSVAAAFVLLTLGAGANLGLIAWIFRNYGFRKGVAWIVILLAVVLGLAYGFNAPLHPSDIQAAGHTHAFDGYSNPFGESQSEFSSAFGHELKKAVLPHEVQAVLILLSFALAGGLLRLLDRRWRLEEWLEKRPETPRPASRFDVVVPPPVLGGIVLVGLISFSILACYTYYPPAEQIFSDMTIFQTEVLSAATSGDTEHALHFLPFLQDWSRRLEVGTYLREGHLSDYRRMKGRVYRDKLEWLKHAIEDNDDPEEIREYVSAVGFASRRLRAAYRED
ncbi:permease [soil metagenome]